MTCSKAIKIYPNNSIIKKAYSRVLNKAEKYEESFKILQSMENENHPYVDYQIGLATI